jgi:hypothetical protein
LLSENKVVGIHNAHNASKQREGAFTFAENYAREVVTGKIKATPRILEMSVKYLMEVDVARKKQRFLSINERRDKKKAAKVAAEAPTKESEITPELAKRLALEGFGGSNGHQI